MTLVKDTNYPIRQEGHGHLTARSALIISVWQEVAINLGQWSINFHGQKLEFNVFTSIDTVSNYPEIICLNKKHSQYVLNNLKTCGSHDIHLQYNAGTIQASNSWDIMNPRVCWMHTTLLVYANQQQSKTHKPMRSVKNYIKQWQTLCVHSYMLIHQRMLMDSWCHFNHQYSTEHCHLFGKSSNSLNFKAFRSSYISSWHDSRHTYHHRRLTISYGNNRVPAGIHR